MRARAGLALVLVLLCGGSAAAHDLALDQLLLQPDFSGGVLRGQFTVNPHRTRQATPEPAERTRARVIAMLRAGVRVQLDGRPCDASYEVRELWVPAGATLGDVVMLRCALAASTRTLRVFAAAPLDALIVSVEELDAAGAPASQSALVTRGSASPEYRFRGPSVDWRAGGAAQFEPGGAATLPPAPSSSAAPSVGARAVRAPPAPRGKAGFDEPGLGAQALRYLVLGVQHILPRGWDHVLFVASLVLGSRRSFRRLLWQLSAFTLAHTLTLALGALGWVVLPRAVVEPCIAFSVAFVAVENLLARPALRFRPWVVFGFGLLHGQGFAGALSELGLPRNAFLTSLLSFNLGVEIGQLSVVAVLLLGLSGIRDGRRFERWVVRPASLVIAAIGLFWGVQRLVA